MIPEKCPCGLGESYDDCCGQYHRGAEPPSAELLMRARYAAYVVGDRAFLLRTWHEKTRPRALTLEPKQTWQGLAILDRQGGGIFDTEGVVEFRARYTAEGRPGTMHDRSRFVKVGGAWRYVDEV
ncbi:YchJ family metal-binding protein [Dactylosporangium sp. AC04546]|uniref:YchJ family protein n=1 Tax=Dactylosporangium sp. AC04546 TaxID=2862460 RepID=UPI001EE111F6|nr:YchJ family metal-binding protein [Dactylosporangium sp. AC04546]WVK81585.1 YchJ family metal-binding protein [Dactylosporangium sp. AC04546]